MKIIKNNKYNGKLAIGLATVLASNIILSACGEVKAVETTPTPMPIVEETIEITPTPEPTKTPVPELSHDEEIALLNINDPEYIFKLQQIHIWEYEINGEKKIIFTAIDARKNEMGSHEVHELFTDEVIFQLDYSIYENKYNDPCNLNCEKITILNDSLKNATITAGYMIYDVQFRFRTANIHIDKKYDKMLNEENFFEILVSNEEAAEMYLSIVPKEYRVSAEELGLVDNKELVKAK